MSPATSSEADPHQQGGHRVASVRGDEGLPRARHSVVPGTSSSPSAGKSEPVRDDDSASGEMAGRGLPQ